MTRVCSKCGSEKSVEEFSGKNTVCKRCYADEAKRRHKEDPRKRLWSHAKYRASQCGVPFDLTIDDIVVPDICPVLGIPIYVGDGNLSYHSPTIDRFIPANGYTKDNITVISWRANRVKGDSTPEELRMVSQWVDYNGA